MFQNLFPSSSECALRNLSALVQLGNSVEIRNYISLLASILNRLSLDTEANTRTHRHIRSVLICTVCDLESSEQVHMQYWAVLWDEQNHPLCQSNDSVMYFQQSMEDNICVLKDILQMINKVGGWLFFCIFHRKIFMNINTNSECNVFIFSHFVCPYRYH